LAGALFFTAVSATTVGFGKLVPVDPWGKALTILACCWGIIILSLTVTVVQRGLALTDAESLVWQAAKGVSARVAHAKAGSTSVTGVRLLTTQGREGEVVNRSNDCLSDAAGILCCGEGGGVSSIFVRDPVDASHGGASGTVAAGGYQNMGDTHENKDTGSRTSDALARQSLLKSPYESAKSSERGISSYGTYQGTSSIGGLLASTENTTDEEAGVTPSSPGGRVLALHVSR